MVAQAKTLLASAPNITVRQASAEDLSLLADGAVDMAVAGQAAH